MNFDTIETEGLHFYLMSGVVKLSLSLPPRPGAKPTACCCPQRWSFQTQHFWVRAHCKYIKWMSFLENIHIIHVLGILMTFTLLIHLLVPDSCGRWSLKITRQKKKYFLVEPDLHSCATVVKSVWMASVILLFYFSGKDKLLACCFGLYMEKLVCDLPSSHAVIKSSEDHRMTVTKSIYKQPESFFQIQILT